MMKVRETALFCLVALAGGFASSDEERAVFVRWCMPVASAAEASPQKPGHNGRPVVPVSRKNDNRNVTMPARGAVRENTDAAADKWGQQIDVRPEFYAARDVPAFQITLTRKWYQIAAHAWGNYGPLEFWIVGSSQDAARQLDQEYCRVRKQKDPARQIRDCLRRGHNFVTYATDGSAGLNTRRNENEKWSGFIITMSGKYPGPEEEDYMPVVLHEYFHVYQHAHIVSRKASVRERLNRKHPWWSEGGAEYMAQLLYSRQPGVRSGYLRQTMERKLKSIEDLREGERINEIPYGKRGIIAYDLGAWFIAFLIHKTSEEAYRVKFFKDLNEEGFEKSFSKSFGRSADELLQEFHETFLTLRRAEMLRILP